MVVETRAQQDNKVDATLEEQGRALSEQNKTLSEFLLGNERLSATTEQHFACLEEIKSMLMVVSTKQTGKMVDTSTLGLGSDTTMTMAKKNEPTGPSTVTMTPLNGENDPPPEPLHDRDRRYYHIGKVDFRWL